MSTLKNPIPDHAELVFDWVRSKVYQWNQEMYDGSIARFERVRFLDGAFVIPILSDGRILLTLQEQPTRSEFISFPGGSFSTPDENPELCAQRELREETGYITHDISLWRQFNGTSNIITHVYYYVARNCEYQWSMDPDPWEKIQLFPVTFDELLELSSDERFHHHWNLMPIFYEARLSFDKKNALKKQWWI